MQRCRSPQKIDWLMRSLVDQLEQRKLDVGMLSVNAIRTRTKNNLSDQFLLTKKMKEYLCGQWLDAQDIATACKEKIREIFASIQSYRTLCPGKTMQHFSFLPMCLTML